MEQFIERLVEVFEREDIDLKTNSEIMRNGIRWPFCRLLQ